MIRAAHLYQRPVLPEPLRVRLPDGTEIEIIRQSAAPRSAAMICTTGRDGYKTVASLDPDQVDQLRRYLAFGDTSQ